MLTTLSFASSSHQVFILFYFLEPKSGEALASLVAPTLMPLVGLHQTTPTCQS